MRQDWFLVAVLGVSMLAMAQQPKVVNAKFNTEPSGAGLSATVNRFQHSNGPLWLGYEVAAVQERISLCVRATPSHRWTMDVAVSID